MLTRLKEYGKATLRSLAWRMAEARSRLEARRRPTTAHPPAVVVHTFDGYQRFWRPAVHYGQQNLPPGVPWYFVSEHVPMAAEGFTPLLTGAGSFVQRLLRAAEALEAKGHRYLFYLQEDQWLTAPLSPERLAAFVDLMESERLVVLKLGHGSLWTPEIDDIRTRCGRVGADGLARAFRWFGDHRYVMAHQASLFQTRFLIDTLRVAARFGKERPIQHEVFCTRYLGPRTKAHTGDAKPYRIAVWDAAPFVHYIHASDCGQLTDEATARLAADDLAHLYQPEREGEVFPTSR